VRIAAVRALASSDDPAVQAALKERLGDPDLDVQAAARKALVRSIG
jgi:HEAT repeat protein